MEPESENIFKSWVSSLVAEIRLAVESDTGNRGNQQYLPDFVNEIIKISHLLPMWTAVMTNYFRCYSSTASTAAVESSFNDVKHRMTQHIDLPARIDEFVMLHIDYLDGAMKLAAAANAANCRPPADVRQNVLRATTETTKHQDTPDITISQVNGG